MVSIDTCCWRFGGGIRTSGRRWGRARSVRSLTTLAIGDARRPHYWRGELLTILAILQKGEVTGRPRHRFWAGAMGHTQFMPASYAAHAVDFDGDGRRDIWTSVADALASTASFLKAAGWKAGEPWGYEAVPPAGFDFAHSAPTAARPIFDWMALGVIPPSGASFLPPADPCNACFRQERPGLRSWSGAISRTILRYNNSASYALAVGHLADRIAGALALATAWPSAERALDRTERQELQQLLLAQGLEPGGVDGMIGGETKAAIRAFQIKQGLPADGHPDAGLLERLRRGGHY